MTNTWSRQPTELHYTGPIGTYMQMQEFLEQQFVTTRAATYLRAETRFGDSRL